MDDTQADRAQAQLRAGVYGRLSETYDAAESVPTQIDRGTDHAARRGWTVVTTFKDDGYSAFKEITRDGFGELIAAIEAGQVNVVIVRDIDRLTRNLTDWNAFEKACVRHGVRLSAYTGGDLDLSTAEGAYYGGMETLRARRESAVKSARVREAQDREARKGRRTGGGQRWFGYTRIYANPDEPNHKKRHILREEINPVEAEAIRDAVARVLEHGESVASIARDWTARGEEPGEGEIVLDPGNDISIKPDEPETRKFYVNGVLVTIIAERVKYLDADGKLVTESLRDYSKRAVTNHFASLDTFLKRWNEADRKQAIIDELEEEGLRLEPLADEVNPDLDPFDLICHVAYGRPAMTRRQRVEGVRKRDIFSKYGSQARAVLDALIQKYQDDGVVDLGDPRILQISPIDKIGTPVELIRQFGSRRGFEQAVHELQDALYMVA